MKTARNSSQTHFDPLVNSVDDPGKQSAVESFAEGIAGRRGLGSAQIRQDRSRRRSF